MLPKLTKLYLYLYKRGWWFVITLCNQKSVTTLRDINEPSLQQNIREKKLFRSSFSPPRLYSGRHSDSTPNSSFINNPSRTAVSIFEMAANQWKSSHSDQNRCYYAVNCCFSCSNFVLKWLIEMQLKYMLIKDNWISLLNQRVVRRKMKTINVVLWR